MGKSQGQFDMIEVSYWWLIMHAVSLGAVRSKYLDTSAYPNL